MRRENLHARCAVAVRPEDALKGARELPRPVGAVHQDDALLAPPSGPPACRSSMQPACPRTTASTLSAAGRCRARRGTPSARFRRCAGAVPHRAVAARPPTARRTRPAARVRRRRVRCGGAAARAGAPPPARLCTRGEPVAQPPEQLVGDASGQPHEQVVGSLLGGVPPGHLDNELDLDRCVHRQLRHPDGRTRVLAGVAENLAEQLGGAVDTAGWPTNPGAEATKPTTLTTRTTESRPTSESTRPARSVRRCQRGPRPRPADPAPTLPVAASLPSTIGSCPAVNTSEPVRTAGT